MLLGYTSKNAPRVREEKKWMINGKGHDRKMRPGEKDERDRISTAWGGCGRTEMRGI